MEKISYKYILILIISILMIGIFYLAIASSMAITSDYSLTDKTVILDGENDGTVEINLVSENGGNFYALDSDWTLSVWCWQKRWRVLYTDRAVQAVCYSGNTWS